MKFIHHSAKEITQFKVPKTIGSLGVKPSNCLWLAKEGDWEKFVKEELGSEEFKYGDGQYNYKYIIDVSTSGLITLSSKKSVIDFTNHYGTVNTVKHKGKNLDIHLIDWNKVKKDNPDKCGFWLKTFHNEFAYGEKTMLWYASFGFPSVALWNDSCIKSMKMDS